MTKKGTIWIVNYYAAPPDKAGNPRYLELAKHFMEAGYDVLTFNHVFDGDEMFQKQQYGDLRFVHVKSPRYESNGLRRMISIWSFAWRLFVNRRKFDRPDVVLHNLHTPFDYPVMWMAKRLKARYIAEAWDLWPADFVKFGLVKESSIFMKIAYAIEKRLYYNADEIVFTFKGGLDYLKKKGWTLETGGKVDRNHVHYINNGINLEEFDKNKQLYPRKDEDMNDYSLYKIVYLGSIRLANHVKTLIDAAKLLMDNPRYHFFIYGNGNERESLEAYIKENGITNVTFKEKRITLEECAWVVSQATVNIMNYEKGFGWMGVSSGKMFQYLAAGKPIVCNIDIAYDDVITDNNLGAARYMDAPEEYAREIRKIAEQPQAEYDAMCRRVRKTAEDFDYKKLAAMEIAVIEGE